MACLNKTQDNNTTQHNTTQHNTTQTRIETMTNLINIITALITTALVRDLERNTK